MIVTQPNTSVTKFLNFSLIFAPIKTPRAPPITIVKMFKTVPIPVNIQANLIKEITPTMRQ